MIYALWESPRRRGRDSKNSNEFKVLFSFTRSKHSLCHRSIAKVERVPAVQTHAHISLSSDLHHGLTSKKMISSLKEAITDSQFCTGVCCCVVGVFVTVYVMQHRQRKRAEFKRSEKSEFGTKWSQRQHEYHVEKFYETGLTGKHDFHGGYLNFGYWVDANMNYIQASEALLSQVADPVHLNKDSRLLDVANGSGSQDIFYFNKYNPKHIDMIDATLSHHLICKKRIQENGLEDRLTAHYGSAVDLPFQSNSFTHVLSIEGGAHFNTRQKFLREAYRVLEPNGWLSFADYATPRPPKNFIEYAVMWLCSTLWNAPEENGRSCEELKKQLEDEGFVDVVVKDVGEFCIPGYYYESTRPETLAELKEIRGWFATYVASRILDEITLWVYKKNLLTELIAYCRKPTAKSLE